MKKESFGIILPITLLAYFLILMDNSIIFTSSVQIGESLNLTDSSLAWVSNAYTLTFGGFLLLSGRLSDLLGRKRIFQIGLAIFGLSSLVIGLAQNASMMILARAIQGIGSSIIAPTTLALMTGYLYWKYANKSYFLLWCDGWNWIKCWSLDWRWPNQFCILASRLSNQCPFDLAS